MARDEPTADRSDATAADNGAGGAAGIASAAEPAATDDLFAAVETVLAALRSQPLSDDVDDETLTASVERLERLERCVHAEKVRRVGEVESRQAFAGHARSTADLLADRLALTRGEARAHTEAASALEALPRTAELFSRGELGVGQLQQAARGVTELSQHADDEQTAYEGLDRLVATKGRVQNRSQLRQTIDAYIDETAPDALAERERRAWQRRRLRWFTGRDGLLHLDGRFDPVSGAHVVAALEPLARPDGADDDRTMEQRRADALATLARRALDNGKLPQVARQRPHVTVIIYAETLLGSADGSEHSGTADADDRHGHPLSHLDGVGPISSATARQLACDAEVSEVVMTRNGEVLDAGRARREPSARQWAALVARDGGCVGCGASISRCQAHHIVFWSRGGPTDLDNLCLLCWGCHDRVHHHGWTVIRGPDGELTVRSPTAAQRGAAPRRPG